MLRATLFVLAVATATSASANLPISSKQKALTADKVHSRVVVHGDELEFVATLSTEKALRDSGRRGPDLVDSDPHLRAVIDRATGKIRYEVRHKVRYFGPERAFEAVHFQTPSGLSRVAPTLNENAGDDCVDSDTTTNCILSKMVAFPIDEAVLRDVAGRYTQDAARPFTFRLKERSGRDVTGAIMPAEAAGLLDRTSSYVVSMR